jgi:hypothetical protein
MNCRVLFERLLAAKGLAAIIVLVYLSVSWGIKVLVKGLLRVERPIALLTFEEVSWEVKVLL